MNCELDEAHAERFIELDAMSDEQLEREYLQRLRQPSDPSVSRFDMIESLLRPKGVGVFSSGTRKLHWSRMLHGSGVPKSDTVRFTNED